MKQLTKEEMKRVLGGAGEFEIPGSDEKPCQDYLDYCNTGKQINCCSGYVCANNKCQIPTLTLEP